MQADFDMAAALAAMLPEGDWVEAMADEEGTAARLAPLDAIAAPNLEVAMIGPGGFSGTFHGIHGFRDAWRDWLEPFETYFIEARDFRQVGDRILFLGRQTAVPKGGQSAMESEAAAVFIFDGGALRRIEFHLDPAAARRAAGLEEG